MTLFLNATWYIPLSNIETPSCQLHNPNRGIPDPTGSASRVVSCDKTRRVAVQGLKLNHDVGIFVPNDGLARGCNCYQGMGSP